MPESVNFDRIAHRYDETRGGEERGRSVAEALAPHLPAGALLEIGVGTGLIASVLAARGWAVTGIDLSTAMLAQANGRIPGHVARADASAIPLPDHSVDACVAVHVFHLVGDVRAVLAEVTRVLRPGGRLAVVGAGEPATATDISEVIQSLNDELREGASRADLPATIVAVAEEAGLDLVTEFAIHRPSEPVSPAGAAEMISTRVWSRLWDLPAERWTTTVEPAIAALRALPDQTRPRPADSNTPALIFQTATPAPLP